MQTENKTKNKNKNNKQNKTKTKQNKNKQQKKKNPKENKSPPFCLTLNFADKVALVDPGRPCVTFDPLVDYARVCSFSDII